MAYRGNFYFDSEDDFKCEAYECPRCRCCDEEYTPGFLSSEGDGDVPGGIQEFWEEPERACDCDDKALRLALEERDEPILLDEHGRQLLNLLIKVDGLGDITVWDVCRLSEAANETFERLCAYAVDNLILWHIDTWAKYMRSRIEAGCKIKWRER